MDDNRTIQQLAQNVLDAQSACNLSGIIHSFSRDITRLRTLMQEGELKNTFSTDKLNRHPICLLYSSKIASLTYSDSSVEFVLAYDMCKDIAKSESRHETWV